MARTCCCIGCPELVFSSSGQELTVFSMLFSVHRERTLTIGSIAKKQTVALILLMIWMLRDYSGKSKKI